MKIDYTKIIPPRFHTALFSELDKDLQENVLRNLSVKQGLYLHGDVGTGKTYKAAAIAKEVMSKGIEVQFFNVGEFLEKLRDEFDHPKNNDDSLFEEVMNFKGVLVFDDIGAEKTSEWGIERLYLIINKKYEGMLPIIFTSNCDLEILSARMGDRVSSRIVEMAEIIHITGPDKRYNLNK